MDGQTDPLIEVLHRTKKPTGASTGHAVLQSTSILPETKERNGWTDRWTDGKMERSWRFIDHDQIFVELLVTVRVIQVSKNLL